MACVSCRMGSRTFLSLQKPFKGRDLTRQIWSSCNLRDEEQPLKRPRGRPRKNSTSNEAFTIALNPTDKAGRARASDDETITSSQSTQETAAKNDKGKGRAMTSKFKEATDVSSIILSSVAKGTAFEMITLHLLRTAFAMHALERSGGSGDRGVDLTGWWWYPSGPVSKEKQPPDSASAAGASRRRIRVMVQCKYQSPSKGSLGPVHLRELEGTLYRKAFEARLVRGSSHGGHDKHLVQISSDTDRPSSSIEQDGADHPPSAIYRVPLLGILASSTGFSSACARYAQASPFPLLLLNIRPDLEAFTSVDEQASTGKSGTSKNKTVSSPPFAALPNLALLSAAGMLDGRLEFRATRRIRRRKQKAGEVEEEGEEPLPGSIDSPLILFDGKPLSNMARG